MPNGRLVGSAAHSLVEATRREAEPKDKTYAHPIYIGGRPPSQE